MSKLNLLFFLVLISLTDVSTVEAQRSSSSFRSFVHHVLKEKKFKGSTDDEESVINQVFDFLSNTSDAQDLKELFQHLASRNIKPHFTSIESNRFHSHNTACPDCFRILRIIDDQLQSQVTFNDVWADVGTYKDGLKGICIHIDLVISNCKNKICETNVNFYFSPGVPIGYGDLEFPSSSYGNIIFTPSHVSSRYSDVTIFVPYHELDIDEDDLELIYDVDIMASGVLLGSSKYRAFHFSLD